MKAQSEVGRWVSHRLKCVVRGTIRVAERTVVYFIFGVLIVIASVVSGVDRWSRED